MGYFGGRGNGYVGMKMSVNAYDAYDRGEKPLSKWTKQDFLDAYGKNPKIAEEIKKHNVGTLRDNLLEKSGWHHTSGAYNRTDFYRLLDEEDVERDLGHWYVEKKERKPKVEEEPGYYHGWTIRKEYHPYSRHNKMEFSAEPFVNARKKGDWLIIGGGRKKFSTAHIEKQTKNRTLDPKRYRALLDELERLGEADAKKYKW